MSMSGGGLRSAWALGLTSHITTSLLLIAQAAGRRLPAFSSPASFRSRPWSVATVSGATTGTAASLPQTSAAPFSSKFNAGPLSDYVLDVLFMGSGQSSGVPVLKHVLTGDCPVCMDALKPGSKNRRNNVSVALIKRRRDMPAGSVPECVLIDCGKTFRDAVLQLFPANGLRDVSGLLLTHGHADAITGLDDLRDVQQYVQLDPGVQYVSGPIDIFLHDHTFEVVKQRFNYLTSPPPYLDKAKGILERPVSFLRYNVVDVNAEFEAGGIPIRSFPVYHGGEYISLGFDVGRTGEFVYISDVKVIPEATMAYLKSIPRIGCLVLDCLKFKEGNFAHASVGEALAWVDELKPERAFLVGMGCRMGPHEQANEEIRRRGYPHVELAYDGMLLTGLPLA